MVITGATKGLGRSVAKEFAKRNARVILGCKDQDKCIGVRRKIVDSTGNSEVYCSLLDMSSIKSIQEFVGRLEESKFGEFQICHFLLQSFRLALHFSRENWCRYIGQ